MTASIALALVAAGFVTLVLPTISLLGARRSALRIDRLRAEIAAERRRRNASDAFAAGEDRFVTPTPNRSGEA